MTKEEALTELERLISEGRQNYYGYSDDIVKKDIEQFFLAECNEHKHVLYVKQSVDNKYMAFTKVIN